MLTIKGISLKKFIPGIIWFFVVLVLITLPKNDIPEPEGWWGWLKKIYLDKWVHTGIFGILAFLFMYPFIRTALPVKIKWQYITIITIAVSVWGGVTELIQLYVPGRSCDILDWIADSLGGVIAMLFCRRYYLKKTSEL